MLETILFCAMCALPNAPAVKLEAPKPAVTHAFWDRTARIELATWATVGTADTTMTCRTIAQGGSENISPAKTCKGLILSGVIIVVAEEFVAYELHRHNHHRLERVPRLIGIGANSAGLLYSHEHGSW